MLCYTLGGVLTALIVLFFVMPKYSELWDYKKAIRIGTLESYETYLLKSVNRLYENDILMRYERLQFEIADSLFRSANYKEAAIFVYKCAERGNSTAQDYTGYLYRNGFIEPKSDSIAVEWYKKSARQGNAAGQNSLAYMYRRGIGGLPQDNALAVEWYRIAAEQGDAAGQTNLGYMYKAGLGVPVDCTEALNLFRKSAEQGFAYGQFLLGEMYEYGCETLPKDVTEARYWYSKAAEQGNKSAKERLSILSDKSY